MARFRYKFDILTSRKAFRDLKESSPLRKLLETIRAELSGRPEEPDAPGFVTDGLNKVYDARFINYAEEDDLDRWGETLGLPRPLAGEPAEPVSDEVYRPLLLDELQDIIESLTAEGIKGRVYEVISSYPTIIEIYTLAPDWPLDWWNATAGWTTWVPWDSLVDFLLVLPETPSSEHLEEIAAAVAGVKFATARCLIVTDSGSGYYVLVKEVS